MVHSFKSVRKATDAEITSHLAAEQAKRKEAERADKLSKLKFGVRVMTPDGEGIYLIETIAFPSAHRVVFADGRLKHYLIDELTILP
jgi:hypothetical protein